ncbi:MAG: PEP-CTERM sorting domain-containing protein, partial [Cyanobacteriota bacterium]|nr:PEP-CTERM sorting domain-containing protein [Cyanobacteriota bacterium]
GLIATSAIALSAESARAFDFNAVGGTGLGSCAPLVDDVTVPLFKAFIDETDDISTCTTEDGFTLNVDQPGDGFLQGKKVGDVTGVGISVPEPGPVPGEIQHGEILDVTLDEASKIGSIDLGFLYLPPVFIDKVFEVAEITAKIDGNDVTGTLTVTGEDTAVWSLGAIVQNLALSKEVEGGSYSILDPFGEDLVSSLIFTAPDVPGIDAPRDSDYALVGIAKADEDDEIIPEPATLLGLGVVGGLMAVSRRKKSSR